MYEDADGHRYSSPFSVLLWLSSNNKKSEVIVNNYRGIVTDACLISS